MRAEEEI